MGFERGKIMPSRAFCSDENQGYPIILIAKHFGTFPFNHGRVGGVLSSNRHRPHAAHGEDYVIIQASHVGYDPSTGSFGSYRRIHTHDEKLTATCGKISGVIDWYQRQYDFAKDNIWLERSKEGLLIRIDNGLLHQDLTEGLLLNFELLVSQSRQGQPIPIHSHSTSKSYEVKPWLQHLLGEESWPAQGYQRIGSLLSPELFDFRRSLVGSPEGSNVLEQNLLKAMPWIVTSSAPLLTGAKINTLVEFDRAFRTILKSDSYRGKRVVYIAGLHIDISPHAAETFPVTKFVPWAAYVQSQDNSYRILEQQELVEALKAQDDHNPDQIDLEAVIQTMADSDEIKIDLNHRQPID